jgi:protein phosphatase
LSAVFSALTHPGRRDGGNQDAIGWNERQGLWFVADGMGGHERGQVASALVKATLLAADAATDLAERVLQAHRAVMSAGASTGEQSNMGSTVVCARFNARECEIVWVGDSRGYLWRRGRLSRLTRDHSYVESLRQGERISEAQARAHPEANVLTQTLGMGNTIPSRVLIELQARDWIILCSDGLTSELDDPTIADLLTRSPTPQAATERLLDAALAHGGRDNVSIVVVPSRVSWTASLASGWRRLERTALLWLAALAGAALAVLVVYLAKHFGMLS